jgi:uncharacterized surface protein with fasciclin (FAS1) repeats
MKRTRLIGGMLALAIGVFTFTSPISASASSMTQSKNIVQTAVDNGNFTTLAKALTCTDLAGLLQTRWLRFTVFAPTDAAFAKLNLNSGNVCSSFSKGQLRNILLYHVNLGQKDAATVLSRQKLLMTNLQFADINPTVPSIDGAKIVLTDIRTSNGIIHALDSVMLP